MKSVQEKKEKGSDWKDEGLKDGLLHGHRSTRRARPSGGGFNGPTPSQPKGIRKKKKGRGSSATTKRVLKNPSLV